MAESAKPNRVTGHNDTYASLFILATQEKPLAIDDILCMYIAHEKLANSRLDPGVKSLRKCEDAFMDEKNAKMLFNHTYFARNPAFAGWPLQL